MAGKPRAASALAALTALSVPDAAGHVAAYAERKQARLEALIEAKAFTAFPDALRFVHALDGLGWPMAAASSSKNANGMLRLVPFDGRRSLFDVFAANVCGRDLPRGKPDPAIFLLAAQELGLPPGCCFVVEDAAAGVAAARAAGMAAIGVARVGDAAILRAAGAGLTVTSLDQVVLADLASGHLCRRAA